MSKITPGGAPGFGMCKAVSHLLCNLSGSTSNMFLTEVSPGVLDEIVVMGTGGYICLKPV